MHIATVFGGAERTTANLLTHLDRRVIHRITLVAPRVLKPLLPHDYDAFYAADDLGLLGYFCNTRNLLSDARKIGALLQEIKPDIALGMMHYPSALVVLGHRLVRGAARIKTVASYRGPFYEYMRHHERGLRRRAFLWTAVASTAWLADHVIVPSHGTAQELHQRFFTPSRRITAIHNGIDFAAVTHAASAPAPELSDIDRTATPILCAIARLSPEKNLQLLLAAFRHIHAQRPAILIILGDGPERAALEMHIAACGLSTAVRLLGHRENVYPYLRTADIFVHTCQFEGFGYTMLEAMACGTAVVATDCPYGPREVLDDGRCGVLTVPTDTHALANAVSQLLADDKKRQALQIRGIDRAKQLSTERMAAAYLETFLTVVRQ